MIKQFSLFKKIFLDFWKYLAKKYIFTILNIVKIKAAKYQLMHAGQLHKTSSQFLITVLNNFKFAEFFIRYGGEFQVFDQYISTILAPTVT